jgi:hypothetical protein
LLQPIGGKRQDSAQRLQKADIGHPTAMGVKQIAKDTMTGDSARPQLSKALKGGSGGFVSASW